MTLIRLRKCLSDFEKNVSKPSIAVLCVSGTIPNVLNEANLIILLNMLKSDKDDSLKRAGQRAITVCQSQTVLVMESWVNASNLTACVKVFVLF